MRRVDLTVVDNLSTRTDDMAEAAEVTTRDGGVFGDASIRKSTG